MGSTHRRGVAAAASTRPFPAGLATLSLGALPRLARDLLRLRGAHPPLGAALREPNAVSLLKREHVVHELHAIASGVPVHNLAVGQEDEGRDGIDAKLARDVGRLGVLIDRHARPPGEPLRVSREGEHGGEDVEAPVRGILVDADVHDGELLFAGDVHARIEAREGTGGGRARFDKVAEVVAAVDLGDIITDVETCGALTAVVEDALGELRGDARPGADVLPHEVIMLPVLVGGELGDVQLLGDLAGLAGLEDLDPEEDDVVRLAGDAREGRGELPALLLVVLGSRDVVAVPDIVAHHALLLGLDGEHDELVAREGERGVELGEAVDLLGPAVDLERLGLAPGLDRVVSRAHAHGGARVARGRGPPPGLRDATRHGGHDGR
mmetsp:Transcript_2718/g.11641  ORF Transcript_2718/g.11641 Transcript_2718/m.11641 type:complete len:381 (-) Transcript_2718:130-1272(-)